MKDIFLIAISLCLLMFTYCHANGNYIVHSDGTVTMIGDRFEYQGNNLRLDDSQLNFSAYDYRDRRRDYESETQYEREYRVNARNRRSRG